MVTLKALGNGGRAACTTTLIVALTPSFAAQTDEPVWPIGDGTLDVMSGFQHPVPSFAYLHEGVDIAGTRREVVAMRSGVVSYVDPKFVGGAVAVQVEVGDRVDADLYVHILPAPWMVGDTIEAGDKIGIVSDRYFDERFGPYADHVHITRYRDYTGGHGVTVRPKVLPNILPPFGIFDDPRYRDPQMMLPGPQDANNDGWVFAITRSSGKYNFIENAFRGVDLIVEATDRQNDFLFYNQTVVGVGYWIEALTGGENVRGPEAPYRLVRFNDAWRGSHCAPDSLIGSIFLTSGRYLVSQGNTVTGFRDLANYIVTNTSGTTGLASEVDESEHWRTDARVETGSPNGTGGRIAREIHEARFPDGRYRVHALVEDLVFETESTFDLLVDNFRPYVEAVRVQRHDLRRILYDARWRFDSDDVVLRYSETSTPGPLTVSRPDGTRGDGILIEIEFSEPMSVAAIESIDPSIGFVPVLAPVDADARRWAARIPRSALGPARDRTHHRLSISGADLAGTTLYPLDDTSERRVPIGKRVNTTPLANATLDTVHLVPFHVAGAADVAPWSHPMR